VCTSGSHAEDESSQPSDDRWTQASDVWDGGVANAVERSRGYSI